MRRNDSALSKAKNRSKIALKNTAVAYCFCIIICISTAYSGFSLTLISASSVPMLRKYYSIDWPQQVMLSLLNGILPIGGMLGCLLLPYFVALTNRKSSHYILLFASIVICGITVIPASQTLIIGRFLLGILNAFYISIAAAYIRQLFPFNIRKTCGAMYACGRIAGILICYSIGYIMDYTRDEIQHIYVFFGPAYLAFIQAILIYVFLPNSPIQMINQDRYDELRKSLSKMYHYQDIEDRISQLKEEIQQIHANSKLVHTEIGKLKFYTTVHFVLLRQFCGVTYIVVYAGQILRNLKHHLAIEAPVIINGVQFLSGLLGIIFVNLISRRPLVTISTFLLSILNLLIGVADLIEEPLFCIVSMILFMIPCGSCLTSVAWSYPNELVGLAQGKYTSLLSWMGATVITLVPPYILNAMPNNSAYPIFFFFSFYLSICVYINQFIVVDVETDHQLYQLTLRQSLTKDKDDKDENLNL